MQEGTSGPGILAVTAKAEQLAERLVGAAADAPAGQPRIDAQRYVLESELRDLPGPVPIHPRVKTAGLGAGAGFGLGKLVTTALVGLGWVDPDTATTLEPFIDLVGAVGGAFLGGWLPKA